MPELEMLDLCIWRFGQNGLYVSSNGGDQKAEHGLLEQLAMLQVLKKLMLLLLAVPCHGQLLLPVRFGTAYDGWPCLFVQIWQPWRFWSLPLLEHCWPVSLVQRLRNQTKRPVMGAPCPMCFLQAGISD